MQKQQTILPRWWPDSPPIYDIAKTYLENATSGPFFNGEIPQRLVFPEEAWIDFLGIKIASPIGVPAGPLLNSQWTSLASQLGFDIVTYKTIRSKPQAAHPLPNMVFVDAARPLTKEDEKKVIKMSLNRGEDIEHLSLTNSFGIPSFGAAFLIEDIAKARKALHPGQALIVSFVGTPREGEDFEEDFVLAAEIAAKGGAMILEADLSCPNVTTCEGSLFTSADSVYRIASKIKQRFPHLPLVIKVGVFGDKQTLQKVMIAAKKGGVDAICGINTISMQVVNEEGRPALGEKRLTAGVCGGLIRGASLEFTRWARQINEEENLGLVLMSTGGVTKEEHFEHLFEAGADVAMSAIGMLWDPYLALRYHQWRWEKCTKG